MHTRSRASTRQDKMRLKGKVALVTGASSGIGKAIAGLFAKEGAEVILAAKDTRKLKAVQKEIQKEGGRAFSVSMDITKRNQVYNSIKTIIKKYGRVDILVNNAGIARWDPIENVSDRDFDEHMLVNVTGYYNCIKAVVPYMVKRKSGAILNIISGSGKNARAGTVAYSTSKFGAAGLSDAVHEDLKKYGINVTAIYPGKTDTPIHDAYLKKSDPKRKKFLRPEDVAKLVIYAATLPPYAKLKEVSLRPEE